MTADHSQAELTQALWKAINGARAVMVGVVGGPIHPFHPMKGHAVQGESPVWFLCRRDIALVRELAGQTHAALMTVVSEDHHLHASVGGDLTAERDQGRIDQFWNSTTEAWLPEGRTSAEVIVLRFDPGEAEIWLSDNAFKLAWEVAKANYNRQRIDSGERASVRLG